MIHNIVHQPAAVYGIVHLFLVLVLYFSLQWYITSQSMGLVNATSAQILVPIQVQMMKTGLKEKKGQLRR
jgi:hypothetical protein